MKMRLILILVLLIAGSAFVKDTNAQVEGGAIAAIDDPSEGVGGRTVASIGKRPALPKSTVSRRPETARRTTPVPPKPRPWDGFVIGDEYTFMNFEVISAEKPYYKRAAKEGGASGLVQVEILIDTDGRVLKARARTGNKLLHPEAERAALASRFNSYTFGGKPARAIGFLVYRFGSRETSGAKRPCTQDSNGFKSPLRKYTALPFSSAEWLGGDRWLRARMRNDVFDRRIPNGKTRQEITAMFGSPDGKKTIDGREVWFYNINTGETDDINMLAISFDTNGKAYAGLSTGRDITMGAICGRIFPLDSSTF